jgi:ArsR family transcriptional regulator, arsenate/arsenite/antimonite-responsive transcriptional repressor
MSRANRKFDLEKFFVALSDRNRLRLINLMDDDEVCVCFFVEILKMPQPRVSRHLAYLRRAGIVATRREGKWMHYRIVSPADGHAARIFQEVREYLAADREMQQDRARLVKVCCAPALPVPFEDEQIRVTRLACAPGKRIDVPAGASGPALLIALSPARISVIGSKGKASKLNLSLGQTGWQPAGKRARFESTGGAPAELLRFEFKTVPVDAPDGKPKAHDHSNE